MAAWGYESYLLYLKHRKIKFEYPHGRVTSSVYVELEKNARTSLFRDCSFTRVMSEQS